MWNFYKQRSAASSTLREDGDENRYEAEKAFDQFPTTAWVEGKPDAGAGEFLFLRFEKEIKVDSIVIMPGLFNEKYWKMNNRLKKLNVKAGPHIYTLTFPDEMKARRIEIPGGPIEFRDITFILSEVYKGTIWDDTCIAEIALYYKDNRLFP